MAATNANGTGDAAYSWMWTLAEIHVGIMTACMPAMKLFVGWICGEKEVQTGEDEGETIGGGGQRRKKGALEEGVGGSDSDWSARYEMGVQDVRPQ